MGINFSADAGAGAATSSIGFSSVFVIGVGISTS
jgi:hypothetical protein